MQKISWLMLGDVSPSAAVFSAAAVTTRSLVQQQQLTTSIQLLQRPGPGRWLVKCHLSLVPYTGLHWPRLHKVWRLCPLWAGEQGGGRAAVWAQPPPAQSRSLSDDEQQRAESIGKHLLSGCTRLPSHLLQNSIFALSTMSYY